MNNTVYRLIMPALFVTICGPFVARTIPVQFDFYVNVETLVGSILYFFNVSASTS